MSFHAHRMPQSSHDIVQLNVGGKLFETTVSTLQSGGPDSLLAVLSTRPAKDSGPIFIDRDSDIFSILLSLLRSNRLPSTALRRFSLQELADEALYYGIDSRLRFAVSPPQLRGIDAAVKDTIRPAADAVPSTFSVAEDGSVWIAHGGQVSVYDPYLTYTSTIRTHLDDITSICRVWPDIAAIGSKSTAGIHFYNSSAGRHVSSVQWADPTDPRIYKARVNAIADSTNSIFASFDCPHKENAVLIIDKSTLQISEELGRQPGNSAKSIVPEKLTWLPETCSLIGISVTHGAFGYSGYIRMWDPRSGKVVWETNEPGSGRSSSRFGDPMADVDVDVEALKLFKICSKSGDLAMADLRNLEEDPWVYMKDDNPILRNKNWSGSGNSVMLHCYKSQVFVGREGELEVWSTTEDRNDESQSDLLGYKRNYVDKADDAERGVIKRIEGGGNRLFVSREEVEGIEVWESSNFSGVLSVS